MLALPTNTHFLFFLANLKEDFHILRRVKDEWVSGNMCAFQQLSFTPPPGKIAILERYQAT